MKITIEPPEEGQEDEVIIRCANIDDDLLDWIQFLKNGKRTVSVYSDQGISFLLPKDIFYFESVDNKTFAYTEQAVFEVKKKLYVLEKEFSGTDFLRVSKSVIANLSKIVHLTPLFNSRFEAELKNGEKIIISRQYLGDLKKKLGL